MSAALMQMLGNLRGGGGGAIVNVNDNFNRASNPLSRSDGGSWTLVSGVTPALSGNQLVAGAGAGEILADLGHVPGTYQVPVTATVGTFNVLMRIASDASGANYLGIAIEIASNAAQFGLVLFTYYSSTYTELCRSATAVFTSGVQANLSVVMPATATPGPTDVVISVGGTPVTWGAGGPYGSQMNALLALGGTYTGLVIPASGVSYDSFSTT